MRHRSPSTRLTVLAVALLSLTTVAWGASYLQHFVLGFEAGRWCGYVAAVDGELSVTWAGSESDRFGRFRWLTNADMPMLERKETFVRRASLYRGRERAAFGFGYVGTGFEALPGGVTREWSVWVPLWVPWGVVGVGVGVVVGRWWRFRRRAAGGLCVACGYDLRGSGARCPECGEEREVVVGSARVRN